MLLFILGVINFLSVPLELYTGNPGLAIFSAIVGAICLFTHFVIPDHKGAQRRRN
jgi:hypothetical protein